MHTDRLGRAFEAEMAAGGAALAAGELERAFVHYQRAHVLGQRHTLWHLRSHCGLLRVGFARRDPRECLGQAPRLLAALLCSGLWVPAGNPGHARISAFQQVPVAADLRRVLGTAPPSTLVERLRHWG